MSVHVDAELVRQLARLARLKLRGDEVQMFTRQLSEIVNYVEQLQSVDTAGVEPLAHPLPIRSIVREDVPSASFETEQALAAAPQRVGDFFRVPAVLESGA